MSTQSGGTTWDSLSSLVNIISTSPPHQLPFLLPYLVDTLENCKNTFSRSQRLESTSSSHKYKTVVSTLLHGKTVEGRWAAAALIKCTVEVGKWEILHDSTSWIRGLLAILGKPDPPATKSLCILTLTRVYLLSRRYPTLIRGIATPTIPTFITSSLSLITATSQSTSGNSDPTFFSPLLESILYSYSQLLSQYPTIFRPFASRIREILLPLLAPTSFTVGQNGTHEISNGRLSPRIAFLSRQVFVHLHFCAPKNTSNEEWTAAYAAVLAELRTTADLVLRSVIESGDETNPLAGGSYQASGGLVVGIDRSAMGLPKWTGIIAGVQRASALLSLLRQYVMEKTGSAVSFPLGATVGLLNRFFSLALPSSGNQKGQGGLKFKLEFVREEKDGLSAGLPQMLVAAMELTVAMINRLGPLFAPLAQDILEQIIWVYHTMSWNIGIRTLTYSIISKLLEVAGLSLIRSLASPLSTIIQGCCNDMLLSVTQTGSDQVHPGSENPQRCRAPKKSLSSTNADDYLRPSTSADAKLSIALEPRSDLHQAARTLLPLCLSHLQPDYLEFSVRALIDRTAILTQHKLAMTASVFQPPRIEDGRKVLSSILPHLTRAYGRDPELESLVRPRMPVLNIPAYPGQDLDRVEMMKQPESMNEFNEDPSRQSGEGGLDSYSTLVETHASRHSPPATKESEQTFMEGGHRDQAPDSGSDTDTSYKRLAEDTVVMTSQAPTAVKLPAALVTNDPSFIEGPRSKRPRLQSPQNTIVTSPTAAAESISSVFEEQPIVVAAPASQPPHTTDTRARALAGVSSGQQSRDQDQESDDSFEIPPVVIGSDTEDEQDDDDGESHGEIRMPS